MQQVQTEIKGSVGIIKLVNPPLNYMTGRMVRELDTLTIEWAKSDEIRSIIITGATPDIFITHFSADELAGSQPAGGNIKALHWFAHQGVKMFSALEAFPALHKQISKLLKGTLAVPLLEMNRIHNVFRRLEMMNKPVIAAINGTCMGGGCELALSCDYRFMANGDYSIGLIEVLAGIIPGAGGTQRLSQLLGPKKAIEMILDGEVLNPKQAIEKGLVSKLVEPDQLMDEVIAFAERLSHRANVAVGAAKRAVYEGHGRPMRDAIFVELGEFIHTGLTKDPIAFNKYYAEEKEQGTTPVNIFKKVREGGGLRFEGESVD